MTIKKIYILYIVILLSGCASREMPLYKPQTDSILSTVTFEKQDLDAEIYIDTFLKSYECRNIRFIEKLEGHKSISTTRFPSGKERAIYIYYKTSTSKSFDTAIIKFTPKQYNDYKLRV